GCFRLFAGCPEARSRTRAGFFFAFLPNVLLFLDHVDRFFTGTGTPAIFTVTEKSVLLVVK
ncbi:MAG: hypothetical protein HW394_1428, partial [Acidobacteria bacterium]|nr:hypothetical protein [Acidobacteriota bacterium]